jgi:hypothetical protein
MKHLDLAHRSGARVDRDRLIPSVDRLARVVLWRASELEDVGLERGQKVLPGRRLEEVGLLLHGIVDRKQKLLEVSCQPTQRRKQLVPVARCVSHLRRKPRRGVHVGHVLGRGFQQIERRRNRLREHTEQLEEQWRQRFEGKQMQPFERKALGRLLRSKHRERLGSARSEIVRSEPFHHATPKLSLPIGVLSLRPSLQERGPVHYVVVEHVRHAACKPQHAIGVRRLAQVGVQLRRRGLTQELGDGPLQSARIVCLGLFRAPLRQAVQNLLDDPPRKRKIGVAPNSEPLGQR